MSDTAVAVDLDKSRDVEGYVTAKVTFYCVGGLDLVTKLCNLSLCKVFRAGIRIDTCLCENVICALAANTVDVGKGDLNALVVGYINTSYTCPSVISPLCLVFSFFVSA